MTPADHRAECIQVMKLATFDWLDCFSLEARNEIMILALDSLPLAGARVVPAEPTEEMIEAGQRFLPYEGISNRLLRNVFIAMSAYGDLTAWRPHCPPKEMTP